MLNQLWIFMVFLELQEHNVTAYYGVSSEENYEDLDSTDLGYNINGSAGFFIGINGDETTIYVPISD